MIFSQRKSTFSSSIVPGLWLYIVDMTGCSTQHLTTYNKWRKAIVEQGNLLKNNASTSFDCWVENLIRITPVIIVPGTENSLLGKHTTMYGKGTELRTTTSKGCYTGINTQLHGGLSPT